MNVLAYLFHRLRVWTGLAEASESRLTPDHGWLLPSPAEARQQQADSVALRGGRKGGVAGPE